MTIKIFSAVIIIIGSLFASTVAQTAEPPSPGLTLTLSLDRKTYLEHEPILAEWTISNQGKAAVNLPLTESGILISFHSRNAQGKIFTGNYPLSIHFFGPPVPRKLKPGETLKWATELQDFINFDGTGEFKLYASYDTTRFGKSPGFWSGKLNSPAVSFKIESPKGEDAKALALIAKKISDLAREGEEAPSYGILANDDLCRDILGKTRSARYCAAANFTLGLVSFYDIKRSPEKQFLNKAIAFLQQCISNKQSSPYLQGLAKSYILRIRMTKPLTTPRAEIEKMAQAIIKDHPNTFMAAKARDILADKSIKSIKIEERFPF